MAAPFLRLFLSALLAGLGVSGWSGGWSPLPVAAQSTPVRHFRIHYRVVHSQESASSGRILSADTTAEELWVGPRGLSLISGPNRYLVDPARRRFSVHSEVHRTSVHIPLPIDILEALTGLGALRLRKGEQLRPVPAAFSDREASRDVEPVEGLPEGQGAECVLVEWAVEGLRARETVRLCLSQDPLLSDVALGSLATPLLRFLHPLYPPDLFQGLDDTRGAPVLWEHTRTVGEVRARETREMVRATPVDPGSAVFDEPRGFIRKERISYSDLLMGTSGPPPPPNTPERKEVVAVLDEFRAGYLRRDTTEVEAWVERVFSSGATVIGTNSVFPGDFEWRSGREAAVEMFENDWRRWGDLEMYLEDAEISIQGDWAWVAIVGTVRRDPSQGNRYRQPEASRIGSLSRIRSFTEQDIPSRLALYEIIHDASQVLVQYERGLEYLWPIRMSFFLGRGEEGWRIHNLHWSFPGRGFPPVRLFENEGRK